VAITPGDHGDVAPAGLDENFRPSTNPDLIDKINPLLVRTDALGGSRNDFADIGALEAANWPPIASFTANPTEGYLPLEVAFDASGSSDDGEIVSYEWDFGDGTRGSGIEVEHRYLEEKDYIVTLIITDNGDPVLTGAATKAISVYLRPGDINGDGEVTSQGDLLTFQTCFNGSRKPAKTGSGRTQKEAERSDTDDDNDVDGTDFLTFLVTFWANRT